MKIVANGPSKFDPATNPDDPTGDLLPYYNGNIYLDPNTNTYKKAWGHTNDYPLQVQDNQDKNPNVGVSQRYGNGVIKEEFPDGVNANGSIGGAVWSLNYFTGEGTPTYNFTDRMGSRYIGNNPPPVVAPATSWLDTIDKEFDQQWYCMKLKNSGISSKYIEGNNKYGDISPLKYPKVGEFLPNVEATSLQSHHIKRYWAATQRSYPGKAAY